MEIWDLYTADRVKTDRTMVRGEKPPKGYWHIVVHVCIFNAKGELLIQQRQPFKEGWPNMWDVTVGGSAISCDYMLSNYKPSSELSRINREAGRGEVPVSEEMAALLELCLRYSRASEGAFDITVGALVKAWGFFGGEGGMPGLWSLWLARRNSGYQHLRVDRAKGTVRFLRSGLKLDPGGIGKGYAVDRAVAALREYGVDRALVSSGASSIFGLGAPPGSAAGWELDLRGAKAADRGFMTVTLKNESLSTSGSYEKFFEKDGARYGHILDPRTGRPAAGMTAVSVIGPSATDTEAWSTALYVNGSGWAHAHGVPQGRALLCPDGRACGWLAGD
ncbi:MAG: FAD:protein FMN transferase [Bryobacterales bacterium]|nr:FAD:protein FMN transferase [Bryobacterales bacterium]